MEDRRDEGMQETVARIERVAAEIVEGVRSGKRLEPLLVNVNFLRTLIGTWDRQRYSADRRARNAYLFGVDKPRDC